MVQILELCDKLSGASRLPTPQRPHVSIRQHRSAYVSIRQHTSAYGASRRRSYVAGYALPVAGLLSQSCRPSPTLSRVDK